MIGLRHFSALNLSNPGKGEDTKTSVLEEAFNGKMEEESVNEVCQRINVVALFVFFLKKWAIPGLFFFFRLLNTVDSKCAI